MFAAHNASHSLFVGFQRMSTVARTLDMNVRDAMNRYQLINVTARTAHKRSNTHETLEHQTRNENKRWFKR